MVRSASTQSQPAAKPRRRSNGGLIVLIVLLALVAGALFIVGFLAPTRLVIPQEQLLGLLHGGVADVSEQVQVECVPLDQSGGVPQAITRSSRTITFRDNTTLIVTFNTSPASTELVCQP